MEISGKLTSIPEVSLSQRKIDGDLAGLEKVVLFEIKTKIEITDSLNNKHNFIFDGIVLPDSIGHNVKYTCNRESTRGKELDRVENIQEIYDIDLKRIYKSQFSEADTHEDPSNWTS